MSPEDWGGGVPAIGRGGARAPLRSPAPQLEAGYSRKKKGSRTASGSDNAAPARRSPELSRGLAGGLRSAPGPPPRSAPAPGRAQPPGGPAEVAGGQPRHPSPPSPRPAPSLLCRQQAAARRRARSPREMPRCSLRRLGRGLMSKPRRRQGTGFPPRPALRSRRRPCQPGRLPSPPPLLLRVLRAR